MIAPYFWGFLYLIWPSEILARFFQVLISTTTVVFTYSIGKRLFNKKIAILAALLMASYNIHLFFTVRLLVYIWAPLFYVLAIFFFLKRDEKNIYLYVSAAIISFGIVTYFSTAFLLIFLLVFLLTIEKKEFFKKKRNYIAFLIFLLVLLPFVTYYMVKIGAPLPRFAQVSQSLSHASEGKILPFANWFDYLSMLPRLLLSFLLYIFIFGFLLLLFKIVLGMDLIWKDKSIQLKNYYFVLLWIFMVIGIYSVIYVIGGDVVYDAFIMPAFPAIFLVCSITLFWVYDLVKKHSKSLAILIVVLLIVLSVYSQLKLGGDLIKGKLTSFDEIRDAGNYIKSVSAKDIVIYSQALPVLTYYSERKVISFPANESEFEENLSIVNPKYMVLTTYERSPDWTYQWAQKNLDKVNLEKTYYYNNDVNQPSTQVISFTV